MIKPILIVTENRNVTRVNTGSVYTGSQDRTDLYRVVLTHGYYSGLGVELYFETDAQASEFSLHTILGADEVASRLGDEKFLGRDIKRVKRFIPNQYTGMMQPRPFWLVELDGDRGTQMKQWFASESAAMNMLRVNAMSAAQVLSLLPAIPRDVVAEIEERIRQAEEEARRNVNPTNPGMNNPPPAPDPGVTVPTDPFLAATFDLYFVWDGGLPGWYASGNPAVVSLGTYYRDAPVIERQRFTYYPMNGDLTRTAMMTRPLNAGTWNNTGSVSPTDPRNPNRNNPNYTFLPEYNFVFYGWYVLLDGTYTPP